MPSYRENDVLRQQLQDLLALYPSKTDIIEEAVARLHRFHFLDRYPDPPHITGWRRITLAQATRCEETGEEIPASSEAWREEMSDGSPGRILSQRGLDEDVA